MREQKVLHLASEQLRGRHATPNIEWRFPRPRRSILGMGLCKLGFDLIEIVLVLSFSIFYVRLSQRFRPFRNTPKKFGELAVID